MGLISNFYFPLNPIPADSFQNLPLTDVLDINHKKLSLHVLISQFTIAKIKFEVLLTLKLLTVEAKLTLQALTGGHFVQLDRIFFSLKRQRKIETGISWLVSEKNNKQCMNT